MSLLGSWRGKCRRRVEVKIKVSDMARDEYSAVKLCFQERLKELLDDPHLSIVARSTGNMWICSLLQCRGLLKVNGRESVYFATPGEVVYLCKEDEVVDIDALARRVAWELQKVVLR